MKPLFLAPFAALCLGGFGRAGPVENAIVAAMRLSEQPSYSWITTVSDDARTYDLEGKTDRSGFTWMRLPMVKEFAKRLGREADADLEAIFHGSSAYVVRTDHGWKTLAELPKRNWDWNDDSEFWAVPASTRASLRAAALGGPDPWGSGAFPPYVLVPVPVDDADERRPYSNAQFALNLPHDDLAIIVSSYAELAVQGDAIVGTLTDVGAQLLLVHAGQDHIKPLCAAGAFRLFVQRGVVTRYHLRLEGIVEVDRKRVHVHQESSTFVKDIGTTTVPVASEARRKLAP